MKLNTYRPESFQPFIGLSKNSSELLNSIMSINQFDAKQIVQNTDSSCRTIYWVMEGAARIHYFKDGLDVTEYFALEGDLIIRAESLFSGEATPKGIETVLPSTILSIPAEKLFELFDEHLEIERFFNTLIRKSYIDSLKRLASLQFKSATERYEGLLKNSPEVVRQLPLKHIASYLGITQVSLSRIRANR